MTTWGLGGAILAICAGCSVTAYAQMNAASVAAYDGRWEATETCPDLGATKGFEKTFTIEVTNGILSGTFGTKNTPASYTYSGRIDPDGATSIHVEGLTGPSVYTVGAAPPGTPLAYNITAKLSGSTGTGVRTEIRIGTRMEIRPCTYVFSRVMSVPGEQLKICDQTVDYRPTGLPSDIQGIWIGRVSFGIGNDVCYGIAVEGLDNQRRIKAKFAWNTSTPGTSIRNIANADSRAGIITRRPDGVYKSGNSWTLRREGNRLVGKLHIEREHGDYDAVLVLQH